MRNLTIWQATAIALEAGAALAIAVLIGSFVGGRIDDHFRGAIPIFTMAGAMLGLASGVYSFIRIVRLTLPRKD